MAPILAILPNPRRNAEMDWNQILEDAILGKLVYSLIDDGYRVKTAEAGFLSMPPQMGTRSLLAIASIG